MVGDGGIKIQVESVTAADHRHRFDFKAPRPPTSDPLPFRRASPGLWALGGGVGLQSGSRSENGTIGSRRSGVADHRHQFHFKTPRPPTSDPLPTGYGSSFRPVNEGFGDDSVPAIGSRSDRHQPIDGTADAREHIVSKKPFDFPAVSALLPQKYWLRVDTDRVGKLKWVGDRCSENCDL